MVTRQMRIMWLAAFVLALLLTTGIPSLSFGQSGSAFDLTWSTIDGGGVTAATGGPFSLGGTIGQPDAGVLAGDTFVLEGGFWYGGGSMVATAVSDLPGGPGGAVSLAFRLYQATPNPFNPSTQIAFDLPHPGRVSLKVYNLRGELVRVLEAGTFLAGHHLSHWDGTDGNGATVASGTYIVGIDADGRQATQKALLVK